MNLLTNSKFISLLWWLLAPALVAKIFISFGLLFLEDTKIEPIHTEDKKSAYKYSFPKFFTTTLKQKVKPKKAHKTVHLGNLKLKACYIEKGREFVIVAEGSKTVFIDLNEEYKGAKLIEITSSSATFVKNEERIELNLVKKTAQQKIVQSRVSYKADSDSKYRSIKRDSFKKYINSPQTALRDIRFQEMRSNNEFGGLRLSFIRKGSLFDRMGLKKGDVIKTIDGNELKSIMDLLPYYNLLDNTTTITIGFGRDGDTKEIMYEIN